MMVIEAKAHPAGLTITSSGHVGYAERGRDIVCAGVSALLFAYLSYVTGCDAYASEPAPCDRPTPGRNGQGWVTYHVGDGYLKIYTRGLLGVDLEAWRVTAAGLLLIAQSYPTYVQLNLNRKGELHGSR